MRRGAVSFFSIILAALLSVLPAHAVIKEVVNTDSTQTLTNKTLTSPVFTGTVTGTYTLGGTVTFSSSTMFASPVFSGTVTGTYTLGGTPTLGAQLNLNGQTFLNTGTLTFPTITDTLVGRATTDTLSNKTFDTAAPNTLKINGNTITASAGTATLTVPNSTDTLTGRATTDTFTNKTLTNPANTAQALADGATVSWDASSGGVATWTIAGNRTLAAATNLKTGGLYTLIVTQDATGGRTIAWNAIYKADGGVTPPNPTPSANAVTTFVFVSPDGTNLKLISKKASPTITVLTTGTAATYTTPIGASRLWVRIVGGGGGGSAQNTNSGNNGTASSFAGGSVTLTANGGTGGQVSSNGGPGGTASGGDVNVQGQAGGPVIGSTDANVAPSGAQGGNSAFGGGAAGGNLNVAGTNASANSGGGGGGAGGNNSANNGSGGGAGGYSEKLIVGPSATYTYTIGSKGTGASAGGVAGGDGAAGVIIIHEFYE
jgi:hypothetical protein